MSEKSTFTIRNKLYSYIYMTNTQMHIKFTTYFSKDRLLIRTKDNVHIGSFYAVLNWQVNIDFLINKQGIMDIM